MTGGHFHIVAGKIASGKSTLASRLVADKATVLISEDEWLAALYGPEMASIKDYVRCSARLRTVMEPHLVALLGTGLSVVLDFPANTPETRRWMKRVIDESGCNHTLHYLNVPDEVCRQRLQDRNAAGGHQFTVSDEQFEAISRHFMPPSAHEGFMVREHTVD
ncbi:ATP-binding protein [Labrenzia sp. CE80]|uniref:AAA family ATPase n=1 Tax=Labrenzia sp. CE80 TaxID=1788986 RepID=UPI00129AC0A6|nr:ATP-binding protein [Labrenzia sp. CE80]